MIDLEKFNPHVLSAEQGSAEAAAVVREVLRPRDTDSVEEVYQKISIFIRLVFRASLKFEDSDDHRRIDHFYAEQIESILKTGRPKYTGAIFVGYRESAKTSRVKFNETYMACYLGDIVDYTNVVSEDGSSSDQFNMDMFNIFAFSKIGSRYFPGLISNDTKAKKKESQTMSKFTTSTGVTYAASGARKSKRGNVKVDINEDAEVETKRPKKVIFDDIENETTVKSLPTTLSVGGVMSATIDGIDQILGFWILLGNYLSLRGNVARMLKKYRDDPRVKIIMIPILDGEGNVTWPGKYVRTDEEESQLQEQGIIRRSVESIQRDSDNFETEYLNNPKRSSVYFEDEALLGLNEDELVDESRRDEDGLLIIEPPQKGATYIICADSAKGNGGDQSAAMVIKTTGLRYEEVANFMSNTTRPKQFAGILAGLGNRYNHALIVPENNFPGDEMIAFLLPIYNNIYHIVKGTDPKTGEEIREYGVNTNLKTKPEMFVRMKRVLMDLLMRVRSRAFYNQILEYPADEVHTVKQKDGSGGHFDLMMAAVIGISKAGTISVAGRESEISDAVMQRVVDSVMQEQPSTR